MDKTKAKTRAARSGFPDKLRRWIEDNAAALEEGRGRLGPVNGRRLALELTRLGDRASDNTTRAWMKGGALPESQYVGHLERMMGAPWAYLDDPHTPWPPADADRELFRLALNGTPKERRDATAAIRSGAR